MRPTNPKSLLFVAAAGISLLFAGCAPTWVSLSDYDQTSPAINGTTIVWEDARNAETDGSDIYTYDSGTRTEELLVGGRGDQEQPTVSGRYVAWLDADRLWALDRSGGSPFTVTTGPAVQSDPVLCGSVVAWTESRNGSTDIYARDLSGGSEIPVATSSAVEAYPDCDAGRIAYMRSTSSEWASIRLFDIASGKTEIVSAKPWNEWRPAISGPWVVWQAWPDQPDTATGIQIRGKDLRTGEDLVVSDGPANQTAPEISGSTVVWEDARSGESRLWWRDLNTASSAAEEQPTDTITQGVQRAPSLSGPIVVYQVPTTDRWQTFSNVLLPKE